MQPRDFYRQPDAADPVLDEATVLGFVRRHLASPSAVTAVDETGGEARAYVIDDKYIFKTQRPHRLRPRTSLAREVLFLQRLASEAPEVSVPRVLGYGREGEVEYILMTRMPGVAAGRVQLTGAERAAMLEALGRSLRAIHRLDPAGFGTDGLMPGDSSLEEAKVRILDGARAACAALDNRGWTPPVAPEALVTKIANLLRVDALAALHSNPGPEHVFVDPDSHEFRGIIDFGDAYISHPALDFRRWTSPAEREAVLRGYGASSPLSDAFMATCRAVFIAGLLGTMVRTPARAADAMADLSSLLNEP